MDRLVMDEDIIKFNDYMIKSISSVTDNHFSVTEADVKDVLSETNVFTSFIS